MDSTICVLLSTYNGEKYIKEQIDSILAQKCDCEISLIIRDDASTDSTVEILKKYGDNRISFYCGDNMGCARSFMQMLLDNPGYDYYAFADQDDYWYEDKLQRGINAIADSGNYALYSSNARMCNSEMEPLGRNVHRDAYRLRKEAIPLGVNGVQGCTCVFNRKLAELIISKGIPDKLYFHDSFIAMLGFLVNADLFYDKQPSMDYRMHGNNTIGLLTRSQVGFIGMVKHRVNQIKKPYKVSPTEQLASIIEKYHDAIPEKTARTSDGVIRSKNNVLLRLKYVLSPKYNVESVNLSITNKIKILIGNY